jgi:methionyl-tRNA formyltransferase
MRVVFMGGRQAGCIGLLAAAAEGCKLSAVIAYDEELRGVAQALGIQVFPSISAPAVHDSLAGADLLISVHGREIVPTALLKLPRLGGINVHPCLYAYKGANPVGRLLEDRNVRASVGVHFMTDQLDGGDVVVERFVDVTGETTACDVYNRLYPHYAIALVDALRRVSQG